MMMNQKAFAILIGTLMVLSGVAYYLPLGTDEKQIVVPKSVDPAETFGVRGTLVEWSFEGLRDVLEMAPQSTDIAYWIDLNASKSLTDAAMIALPQSIGLLYGGQLYSTRIERLGVARFNNTWSEFHWIQPYPMGYDGLVIPYKGYMLIPRGTDLVLAMGRPALCGPQEGIEQTIDVISGGQPAESFTLVDESGGDLQLAALGSGGAIMPLAGGYKEFNLNVAQSGNSSAFDLVCRCIQPTSDTSQRMKDLALKNDLQYSIKGSEGELSGVVSEEDIQGVLMELLGP